MAMPQVPAVGWGDTCASQENTVVFVVETMVSASLDCVRSRGSSRDAMACHTGNLWAFRSQAGNRLQGMSLCNMLQNTEDCNLEPISGTEDLVFS